MVNAQPVSQMTCVSPVNAPCTDETVQAGQAYVQLANRPSIAKLRPIAELKAAAQNALKIGAKKATKTSQQIIQVDPSISYHLFTEILMSLTQAGVTEPRLKRLGDASNVSRSITRSSERFKPKPTPTSPLNVALIVNREGYRLLIHKSHRSQFDAQFFQPVKGDEKFKNLDERLKTIKTQFQDEERVNLAANPEVSMGRVISAIDVVKKYFPQLKLVPGPSNQRINMMNKRVREQLKAYRDTLPPKKNPDTSQ